MKSSFHKYKHYNLGDEVKITVYSANGFLILRSSIIVKDSGFVMVINPKENQKLVQKREHPRVNVELSGLLHGVTSTAASNENLAPPVPISIQNVSIGGIGFLIDAEHHICPSMFLDVELKLGSGVSCQLQVIRRSMSDKGAFIGPSLLKSQMSISRCFAASYYATKLTSASMIGRKHKRRYNVQRLRMSAASGTAPSSPFSQFPHPIMPFI